MVLRRLDDESLDDYKVLPYRRPFAKTFAGIEVSNMICSPLRSYDLIAWRINLLMRTIFMLK